MSAKRGGGGKEDGEKREGDWREDVDPELVGEVLDRIESAENKELKNTRILALLLNQRRSVGELIKLIYGKEYGQKGYRKLYMRVSRRLDKLEREGLVSRAIFGKERPYHITRLGRLTLSSTLSLDKRSDRKEVTERSRLWSRWHSLVLVLTALFLVIVLTRPLTDLHQVMLLVLFFLAGCSVTIAVTAIREVF